MANAVENAVVAVAEPKKLILSVDQMLSADDVEYAEIPAWKIKGPNGEMTQGYVRIASLSAEDVAAWRDTSEGPAKKTMGVRLFVNSLVDEKGTRIGGPQHYEAFKKKSNAVQERVLAEILKMNNMTQRNEKQVCPKCGAKFDLQTGGNDETKNG